MQKYRLIKIIFTISIISVFSVIAFNRFRYTEEERIIMFYEENADSFNLLKDCILRKDNVKVDSLQKELKTTDIWISNSENNTQVIHFQIDLNNYIGYYEYWYSQKELDLFEAKDGPALRKINKEWYFFK